MGPSESDSVTVSRRGSAPGELDADSTVVWLRGEHDLSTKADVMVTIARAAQRDDADLLVDLSGVTFMDASTIGALVRSRNRLRARSQSLRLRAPSPLARRILELCGLAHLVHHAGADPPHRAGVAAALGTWIDVPAIRLLQGTVDPAAPSERPESARRVRPVGARPSRTSPTIEADRGGP